jgi:putative flavoprotein involved in K+ transport
MDRPLDAVVIGAGWAGLGVSFVLAKAGLSHRVLERGDPNRTFVANEIGEKLVIQ